MNNEIIKLLSPKEYISTFISKGFRHDRRGLIEKRSYSYQFGVLDNFPNSSTCMLGSSNKIISVLKIKPSNQTENKINFIIDGNLDNIGITDYNILNFINKLTQNNLDVINDSFNYTLYIKIINNDGNLFDCIGYMLINLFNEDNKYLRFNKYVKTNTFCIIEDNLILDPNIEELNVSNYYFSIIYLENEEYLIHKIKGDLINNIQLMEGLNLNSI